MVKYTEEEFKEIKEMSNLTFKELSYYTGVTAAMLRNYAAGDNPIPDYVASMMLELEEDL